MSILNPNSITLNFNDIPYSNANSVDDVFILFDSVTGKPTRLSSDSIRIGLENVTFKPTIDRIVKDAKEAKEIAANNIQGDVSQYEYVTSNNSSAIRLNPFVDPTVTNRIPLNTTHVRSNSAETTTTTSTLSIQSTTSECEEGDESSYGLQSDNTMFEKKGLYRANIKVVMRNLFERSDTLITLVNNTIKSQGEPTLLMSSDRKILEEGQGSKTFTLEGYFYLCKDCNISLQVYHTGTVYVGELDAGGELGQEETGMPNLNIPVIPVVAHFEYLGEEDNLQPNHGGV